MKSLKFLKTSSTKPNPWLTAHPTAYISWTWRKALLPWPATSTRLIWFKCKLASKSSCSYWSITTHTKKTCTRWASSSCRPCWCATKKKFRTFAKTNSCWWLLLPTDFWITVEATSISNIRNNAGSSAGNLIQYNLQAAASTRHRSSNTQWLAKMNNNKSVLAITTAGNQANDTQIIWYAWCWRCCSTILTIDLILVICNICTKT